MEQPHRLEQQEETRADEIQKLRTILEVGEKRAPSSQQKPFYYEIVDRMLEPLRVWTLPLILLLVAFVIPMVWYLINSRTTTESAFQTALLVHSDSTGGAPGALSERVPVRFVTSPPGAAVLADADTLGRTPLDRIMVPPGIYILSYRLEGYVPVDTVVNLETGRAISFFEVLVPAVEGLLPSPSGRNRTVAAGRAPTPGPVTSRPTASTRTQSQTGSNAGEILVASEPSGASVWLDGSLVGATPSILKDVPSGTRTLALQLEGYEAYTVEVDVTPAETSTVLGHLQAETGLLIVLAKPWGSLFIDDKLVSRNSDVQHTTHLSLGIHQVRVEHPILGVISREVVIKAGTPVELLLEFDKSLADAAPGGTEEKGTGLSANWTEVEGLGRVYDLAEEPPQLIGGLEGMHRLARYPESAYSFGVEGKVYLSFIVDRDGRVQNPVVSRGLAKDLDAEALRVIRLVRFEPGKINGQSVISRHALFISFKIDK